LLRQRTWAGALAIMILFLFAAAMIIGPISHSMAEEQSREVN
jgi:hypothetical protein